MKINRRTFCVALAVTVAGAGSALAQDAAPTLEINYETSGLARRIEFGPAQFRIMGRYQMFQVQAQNITSRDQRLEYKIDWFDAGGFSVQTTSNWMPLTLSPRQFQAIQSVGQVATAHSARLTLRDPD